MAEEYEDAFAFYDSLDEDQLTLMYQSEQVSELTCQPGSTGDFTTGTGIAFTISGPDVYIKFANRNQPGEPADWPRP